MKLFSSTTDAKGEG